MMLNQLQNVRFVEIVLNVSTSVEMTMIALVKYDEDLRSS